MKVFMLCLIILLMVLCSCKNTTKENIEWEKTTAIDNKISFIIPKGTTKSILRKELVTSENNTSFHLDSFHIADSYNYKDKHLFIKCDYVLDSDSSAHVIKVYEKELSDSSYKKFETRINGKTAIIIKYEYGLLGWEYWVIKAIFSYRNIHDNSNLEVWNRTVVYFPDIDGQKTKLRISFDGGESCEYIMSKVINSVMFLGPKIH